MAEESWIVDQETLDTAKQESLDALHAMQPYGGMALNDDQRQTLGEIDGQHRQRISLIDGVKSAMGALMAHGYPGPVDTSGLAPFQSTLEEKHEAEGAKLEEMAEHVDAAPPPATEKPMTDDAPTQKLEAPEDR